MIVSVWAAKGGTAKTTTAGMLAFNTKMPFSERFLVDLDPQGGGLRRLSGVQPTPQGWKGTTDLLLQFAYGNSARVSDDVLLSLSDSTILMRADRYLGALGDLWPKRGTVREAYEALKACLYSLDAQGADTLTVLDCPPGSCHSLLPKSALSASDYVLIPVTPEPLSLDGLVASIEDLRIVRDGDPVTGRPPINPDLKILGVLRSKVSQRKDGVSRAVLERLPRLLEDLGTFGGEPVRLLETTIRQRVEVQRHTLNETSVFQVAAGDAFDDAVALGEEVARLLGKSTKEGDV